MDDLLAEQRRRWRGGDRVLVEVFLERVPSLAGRPEALLDLVYNEFLLREEAGAPTDLAEYQRRFPHLAEQIELLFRIDHALAPDLRRTTPTRHSVMGALTRVGLSHNNTASLPTVAGYEVLGVLGRGGMGVVYKARHLRLDRVVALKMISAGSEASGAERARFRREAEAVARLQHPNIVQIFEVGEHEGQPYLALEYVEGVTLAPHLRGKPQPAQPTAELLRALALAIHHAHERGVIHRDLKPGNVLLGTPCPVLRTPKITDFGLAKRVEVSGVTVSGGVLGTPSYMAPEQARQTNESTDHRADIYSLGAILYEMLTGRAPFQGETPLEILSQVVTEEPVPPRSLLRGVPSDLETICLKCLEKEPHRRYASALELADDLGRFLTHEPIHARPVGWAGRAAKWARRRPAVAALLALVALLVVVGFSLVSWKWLEARAEWERAEDQTRQAEQALGAAKEARADAEARAAEATEKGIAEAGARKQADRLSILLALDRAQTLSEQGEAARGLLWFARALEIATRAEDRDFEGMIRASLADWRRHIYSPRTVLPSAGSGYSTALSPDGKTVLDGGGVTEGLLWDVATGKPLPTRFPHKGRVMAVAFSSDGRLVLTGSQDRTARLWDVAGNPKTPSLDHPSEVRAVALSPDGKVILTGCGTQAGGEGRLWDGETGKAIGEPMPHKAGVRGVAFSPDGGTVLTVSDDGTARLWDRLTKPKGAVMEHGNATLAGAFSPDGKTVLTGGSDHTARFWDAVTGKPIGSPLLHPGEVWSVAYSPDGRLILTGTHHQARLWDASTGRPVSAPLSVPTPAYTVAFSRDGRTVVTVASGVRLWEAAPPPSLGAPLWAVDQVRFAVYSPDGRSLLMAQGGFANLWNASDGKASNMVLVHGGVILGGAFSPDGKRCATASGDKTARLWETATKQPVGKPLQHGAAVNVVAFSPDGTRLLTGSQDNTGRLWDIATGEPIGQPLGHTGNVLGLAFSPDGKIAVTASEDRTARLWDATTGKPIGESLRHDWTVASLCFSPDGQTLLTGGRDRKIKFWDAKTGKPKREPWSQGDGVESLVFTAGGKVLLTNEGEKVRLWDAATGEKLGSRFHHDDWMRSFSLGTDGKTLLTGSMDQTARFWDMETRREVGAPLRHPAAVDQVAFSPSGETAVTVAGGRARAWPVPKPVGGSPERIRLWVQVLTGMELDGDDVETVLPAAVWEARRKELGPAQAP